QDRQQRREVAFIFGELDDYAATQIGFQRSEKSRKILLLLDLCLLTLKLRYSYRLAMSCLWTSSVIRRYFSMSSASFQEQLTEIVRAVPSRSVSPKKRER